MFHTAANQELPNRNLTAANYEAANRLLDISVITSHSVSTSYVSVRVRKSLSINDLRRGGGRQLVTRSVSTSYVC